jgi:hypothetical protein
LKNALPGMYSASFSYAPLANPSRECSPRGNRVAYDRDGMVDRELLIAYLKERATNNDIPAAILPEATAQA